MVQHVVLVDPDGAGAEGVGDLDGRVDVLGVHGRGETVGGVVGNLDDLVLGRELGNRADGAEDFLLHDLHVLGDVGENGGLDEVSLVTVALATNDHLGALLLTLVDVAHDAVVLDLGNLRSLEGRRVEWVTNLVLLGAGLEGLDELVVDALLDVDTGTSAAALAVVEEDAEVDPGDGVLDISIVEDNVGGLATELEGDLLQVGASSGLHDGSADNGGAGECNLVNVHVGGDGGTSNLSETRDDVDDSWGETSLLNQLSEDETGKRGLLSGLQDDGVTSGKGGANLPCQHEKWEVPWDDLTANTNL